MASTIGTAPRSPAQPRSVRSAVVETWKAVEAQTATGLATKSEHGGESQSGKDHLRQSAGEDEEAEHHEQSDLREEGRALVEGDELPPQRRGRCCRSVVRRCRRRAVAAADDVSGSEGERGDADGGNRSERRYRMREP